MYNLLGFLNNKTLQMALSHILKTWDSTPNHMGFSPIIPDRSGSFCLSSKHRQDKTTQTGKHGVCFRYGGHLRPYLSVTCDPTPLKPETRSLATLPLFTAPTTQNYTWSLATLPTTTRENTTRSPATLPTQIGRVTSDH